MFRPSRSIGLPFWTEMGLSFMEFKTRQNKSSSNFKVVINERTIYCTGQWNCVLRVVLDDNLTWKSHISGLADEISKSINIIVKSSFLSFNFFFSHAM